MNVFDTLVERGFIATDDNGAPVQVTDLKIKEILGKDKISCYIGFDPSASSFHVGSLVQIMVLAHMQRAGHRPIIIVGGGTGLVGDPSGKTKMRQLLTPERITENMESQRKQFTRFIDFSDDKALMLNNAEWLAPLNYIEFLRDIGSHMSVNQMLTAESVKVRLETGLSFLEFNYMLLQAYDFLHLFQKHNCVLQMGGNDQWGNICQGLELIRRIAQGEGYGITFPLITTASGTKMGKTEKGAVWLDGNLCSPYDYYQFWRNTDDLDVERFLGLFTFLPIEEVRELGKAKGKDINKAKEILAYEATKLNHGEEEAKKARETARKIFENQTTGEGIPTIEISEKDLEEGIPIIELFHKTGLCSSKGDAKRLVKKNGAYFGQGGQNRVESIDFKVDKSHLEDGEIILRSGKKKYAKATIVDN